MLGHWYSNCCIVCDQWESRWPTMLLRRHRRIVVVRWRRRLYQQILTYSSAAPLYAARLLAENCVRQIGQ